MYNPQLETFIVVADMGSFNKAARVLYITPSAVTKQINLLENDLGLQLFNRTHRGLTLTEAGKSLYKDAKYMDKSAEKISGYQTPADPIYEQPGERPGDPEKPGYEHRYCGRDL